MNDVAVLTVGELHALCSRLGVDAPDVLLAGPCAPAGRCPVPEPRVVDDVRCLARAPLAVDVRLPGATAAVAAVDTGRGVLAVRRDGTVRLHRLTAHGAIGAVPGLLGRLHPARVRPARVPVPVLTAALAAAGDDPGRLEVELMRRGMTASGARALVAANRDVHTVARVGATVRTADGPRRSPYLLTVQRTPDGHCCQRPHRAPGHPDVLEIAPATADRLTRELDDLVRATADGPPGHAGFGVVPGRVAYGTSSS